MKKLIFIIFIFFSCKVKADQLAWISLEQAQKAVNFLNTQSEVISWCACCPNSSKDLINIQSVYYKKVTNKPGFNIGDKNLYEVFIKGEFKNGDVKTIAYDLAYLHIRKNDLAYNLGLELDFDCDPCTEPFDWIKIDENGFQFIGKSNDNIEYWIFIEAKEYLKTKIWVKTIKPKVKKKNGKGKYVIVGGNYSMSFINLNCHEKEYEIIEVIDYDSSGKVIKSYKSYSLNKIVPGSIMDSVYVFSCK